MKSHNRALMFSVVAAILAIVLVAIWLLGRGPARQVVVYTSVDMTQAAPVLKAFEQSTGIAVRPLYDTEASKTTGLALRLISETARPKADVFWNNELSQTLHLAGQGVLAPYASPSAADIPAAWKDAGNIWAAFALRARVIAYNATDVTAADAPRTLEALASERWKGRVGIADPRFGTTRAHVAALCLAWGADDALEYFGRLRANEVRVYPGNASVRDAVASGEILVGLTDTDDCLIGIDRGMPIGIVIPDQGDDAKGSLIIPNSVSLVAGAPHPAEAAALIDFLLSVQVERSFANPREGWIPIRVDSGADDISRSLASARTMDVDWSEAGTIAAEFSNRVAAILMD